MHLVQSFEPTEIRVSFKKHQHTILSSYNNCLCHLFINSSDLKKIFQQSSITSSPQLNNRSAPLSRNWTLGTFIIIGRNSTGNLLRMFIGTLAVSCHFKMNAWCPLAPLFFSNCFIYLLFSNSIVMNAVYEPLSQQSEGTS